jgi:hypothetical protein
MNFKVPMQEIFVNLTCINLTPVYSEVKSWSKGDWVYRQVTLYIGLEFLFFILYLVNPLAKFYQAVIQLYIKELVRSFFLVQILYRFKNYGKFQLSFHYKFIVEVYKLGLQFSGSKILIFQ